VFGWLEMLNADVGVSPAVNFGVGEWADAYAKARALVEEMTDAEKNNVRRLSLHTFVRFCRMAE
jgi:hypothetical protein